MQSKQFRLNFEVELAHWWFTARRRILRDLVAEILAPSKQATIVDVGCGAGGNIASLAGDYTCVGIDPSAEAIGLARQRFPHVRFICGRAPDDLGQLAGQTRLFMLNDVLEHVADDFALLSRLLAAAGPGTHFLVTVPADPSLWSPHDESHGHYRRYDLMRLQRLWQGLPVTVRLSTYFNSRLFPVIKRIRALNRWRGEACGEAETDVKMPSRPVNRVLELVFQGESRMLKDLLHGRRRSGFSSGVSLVAVLRRETGPIAVRRKPAEVAADHYDPTIGQDPSGGRSKEAA